MAKLFECLGYVPWHINMYPSIFVVPFQSDAHILHPFVVNGGFINVD